VVTSNNNLVRIYLLNERQLTRTRKRATVTFISIQNKKKRNGNNTCKEINGQAYYGFDRKTNVMLTKRIKKYAFRHSDIQNSSPTAMSKMRPFYICSVLWSHFTNLYLD